ncbi:MAG: hypothetical protein AB3N16_03635 [Flavobacteriaceae bacterium]
MDFKQGKTFFPLGEGFKGSGRWTNKAKSLIWSLFFMLVPFMGKAQCSMCRAVLETQGDTSTAQGINDGIVYLMAIPYVLVGAVLYLVYRKLRK